MKRDPPSRSSLLAIGEYLVEVASYVCKDSSTGNLLIRWSWFEPYRTAKSPPSNYSTGQPDADAATFSEPSAVVQAVAAFACAIFRESSGRLDQLAHPERI